MRAGTLALTMFTWIVGSESARRKNRKISTAPSFKNRSSDNGRDGDLSRHPGGFCQYPAFSA
jgi:hypothetical protein